MQRINLLTADVEAVDQACTVTDSLGVECQRCYAQDNLVRTVEVQVQAGSLVLNIIGSVGSFDEAEQTGITNFLVSEDQVAALVQRLALDAQTWPCYTCRVDVLLTTLCF